MPLHEFSNFHSHTFETIGFFSINKHQPEISVAVSSNFFPRRILNYSLTKYGDENNKGHPLSDLKNFTVTPYLFSSYSHKLTIYIYISKV